MNRESILNISNFILFQVGWFAAVLGAARGLFWLGPATILVVALIHLSLAAERSRVALVLLVTALVGILFDSTLVALQVFSPVRDAMPSPLSPLWMVALWVNFATTFTRSLAWLRNRYLLAGLFGALGGPAAYYGGAKLGAMTELPGSTGLFILAIAWGMAVPLLFALMELLIKKRPSQQTPRN